MKRFYRVNSFLLITLMIAGVLVAACGGGGGGGGGGSNNDSPRISVSTNNMDFGTVLLNGDPQSREIVVRNTGSDTLSIGTISDPAGDFNITADNCSGRNLSSSGRCALTLEFDPLPAMAIDQGDYNSELSIPSNADNDRRVEIALTGQLWAYDVAIIRSFTDLCLSSSKLRLLVSVTNNNGDPVPGLDPEFTVEENGVPATITDISTDPTADKSVALALDFSSSLLPDRVDMVNAASSFIDLLIADDPLNNEAALIRFANTFEDVEDFTTDLDSIKAAIEAAYTGPTNGTLLYDATYLMVQQAATKATKPLRAVIVFSDGADNGSPTSLSDVIDLAKDNNIPVFTIYYPTNKGKPEIMQQIAEETGGRFFEAPASPTQPELEDIFEAIWDIISNQYVIEFETAGGDPVWVDVWVDDGGDMGHAYKEVDGCGP